MVMMVFAGAVVRMPVVAVGGPNRVGVDVRALVVSGGLATFVRVGERG